MEALAAALDEYAGVCIYDAGYVLEKSRRLLGSFVAYSLHASNQTISSDNQDFRQLLKDLTISYKAVNDKLLEITAVAQSCADMADKIRSNPSGFNIGAYEPSIKNPSLGL
jgi:hypothetical protein